MATRQAQSQDTYTAAEIIAGHESFGFPKEVVMAAMRVNRVKSATFAEAASIIKKFNETEVN